MHCKYFFHADDYSDNFLSCMICQELALDHHSFWAHLQAKLLLCFMVVFKGFTDFSFTYSGRIL